MADNVCGDRAVSFIRNCKAVPKRGSFVEIGVFKGNSAIIISQVCYNREFHLYDSWEGLPELTVHDEKRGFKGQFQADYETTKSIIQKLKHRNCRTIYHNGLVQDTFNSNDYPDGIAFLHIDVDLYEATLYCLENFWPLVLDGGIVQIDDYGLYPGCKKAVHEFIDPLDLIIYDVYAQPAPVYVSKGDTGNENKKIGV